MRLSRIKIDSFCGDIVPLRLISEFDSSESAISHKTLSDAQIKWTVEGDAVTLREFSGDEEGCFNDGVLVILSKEGESIICAEYDGKKYLCKVAVRKMKSVSEGVALHYFRGDLHIHSSKIHKAIAFNERKEELPEELVCQIMEEGILDFSVITDHAELLYSSSFFRGFIAGEKAKTHRLIVFPGCESGLTGIAHDRYGIPYKEFGEIVTLNAATYANVKDCKKFCDLFTDSPAAVGILAHPQVIGWDEYGVWVSALSKHGTSEFKSLIRLVEMGNGTARGSNLINEYIYSLALDCGYQVAPCCNSDSHGEYKLCPGKTFIMAPDKTKEMFVDALRNARVYACESGVVELEYKVNDHAAPAVLDMTDHYHFSIKMKVPEEEPSAKPVICEVVTDYGQKVKVIDQITSDTLEFTIDSDSARYFYLRLVDPEGRKTWSAPVWTGRAFDNLRDQNNIYALDKKDFTAFDEVSGRVVNELLNDTPAQIFASEETTASIIIDMNQVYDICGVGHMAPKLLRKKMREAGITEPYAVSEFVSEYRISVSMDGTDYHICKEGTARVFGCEEIFFFEEISCRFVKFQVLSTTGRASCFREFAEAKLKIAELSIFAKKQ